MRINAYENQIQISAQSYINKVKSSNKAGKTSSDNVSISKTGDALMSAFKAVKESPDIRKEKVDEIKEKIMNNTYNVSNEDFVDKFLR